MKLAVGGKGGSGKTTIAGTLACILAERGRRVVALDDDSNPNLALTVGLPAASALGLPGIPRDLLEERLDAQGKARLELRIPAEEFLARDYPVLLGIFLLVSVAVVLTNLFTDLAYAWLDPRVRYD